MAFVKKEKPQATKGKNALNDPTERKKFKSSLATITHYFQMIEDQKEGITETISDLSAEYGLDKKLIRKLATTMFKHNQSSLQEENRHFESLYEILIEGKLRDDKDPIDAALDELADAEDADTEMVQQEK